MFKRMTLVGTGLLIALAFVAGGFLKADASSSSAADVDGSTPSVNLEVFTPKSGDVSGVSSAAVMVDLKADFNCSGCSGASPELTGPALHQNTAPFPGTFGLGANKDHFPGLVVLLSSTRVGAKGGQNVANDFNITTITDRRENFEQVWSTWIVGARNVFGVEGQFTPSRLFVTVVAGTAPDVVVDADNNGEFDEKDLQAMGFNVISSAVKRDFIINGFPQ